MTLSKPLVVSEYPSLNCCVARGESLRGNFIGFLLRALLVTSKVLERPSSQNETREIFIHDISFEARSGQASRYNVQELINSLVAKFTFPTADRSTRSPNNLILVKEECIAMKSNSMSPLGTDSYQNLVSPRPYTAMIKWATHPNSGPFTLYTLGPSEEEDRWLGDYVMSQLTRMTSGSCVMSSTVTNSNSVKEEH
jgi:hypothetical protein